jgi:hypothetical protein
VNVLVLDFFISITANACHRLRSLWDAAAICKKIGALKQQAFFYLSCIPFPCFNSCVSSYLGANALCMALLLHWH